MKLEEAPSISFEDIFAKLKKDTKKQVRGVIVCRDIMPAFIDEFRKLSDIQIFRFGWKLTIYPKKWD
jgi:hypothetical protein